MNAYFESSPSFPLEKAILLYGAQHSSYLATLHSVRDGKIQPGKPVDLNEVALLLKNVKGEEPVRTQNGIKWHGVNVIATLSDSIVWWTPAQDKDLFIAGKPEKCWLPALIWCGSTSKRVLYVWAWDGEDTPFPETVTYHAMFGPHGGTNHIFENNAVCLGDSVVKSFTPSGWTEAFYTSNFKSNGFLKGPYKVSETFRKLGSISDQLAKISRSNFTD